MSNVDKDLRIHSSVISEGKNRTPNRAMLRAVGFSDEDFQKPMIGIASTWSEVTPCNMHIDKLALEAKKGAKLMEAVPRSFLIRLRCLMVFQWGILECSILYQVVK